MSAVSPAAITPSRTTPITAETTKTDWSNSSLMTMPLGAAARATRSAFLTALTTVSVEALPFLMMLSSTEAVPSSRTMFCCTAAPSWT